MIRRLLAMHIAALTCLLVLPGCGAVSIPDPAESSEMDVEIARLSTRVAALESTQAALADEDARQAAEITRQRGLLFDLATRAPRTMLQSAPPTVTPWPGVRGEVAIEGGRCCMGGAAGEPLPLAVSLKATSEVAEVTQMRISVGHLPAVPVEMEAQPWQPFQNRLEMTYVPAINWARLVVTVQFRDGRGNLSGFYWDDISVEGLPPVMSSPEP